MRNVSPFRYKNESERGQLNDAMLLLLPQVYSLCIRLLPDPSEQSTLLQKQILKIFFAFTQYTLPVPKVRDISKLNAKVVSSGFQQLKS